jgi:hypothetical protein
MMGEILFYSEPLNRSQFRIDYPYYGLFGSADITPIRNDDEVIYRCKLLNGTIIFLKKLLDRRKWVDANLEKETPLSAIIGVSIDDFLKNKQA